MKLLLTTDWHLDHVTAGRPRLLEMEAHIEEVERAIVEHSIDLVGFLGDAFDPDSMKVPIYTRVTARAAVRFSRAASMGAVFIAGNHCVLETQIPASVLSPLQPLEELLPFWLAEVPRFIEFPDPVAAEGCEGVRPVGLLLLPYVSRAAAEEGKEAMARAFVEAHAARARGVRIVVFGHMTVPGAVLDNESAELARGREIDLPKLGELEPVFVANGHYHEHQVVKYGGVDVVIPGSPLRLTFGGKRDDRVRGYLIAEV